MANAMSSLTVQEFLIADDKAEIDEGNMIQCLIEHKHEGDVDPKCFAGIEHHQIVNMGSYNFNHKFREACKKDYEEHCVQKTNRFVDHKNRFLWNGALVGWACQPPPPAPALW